MPGPNKDQSLRLNDFLPYILANLAKRVSDSCGTIYEQQFDITIPEWRILARLAEDNRQNSRTLGRITFMDKSKVSRAVKQLEAKGYISRERDDEDNRVNFLSLTARGRRLYRGIAPEALAWESQLLDALEDGEYSDLIRILGKLDQRLDQFDEDPA